MKPEIQVSLREFDAGLGRPCWRADLRSKRIQCGFIVLTFYASGGHEVAVRWNFINPHWDAATLREMAAALEIAADIRSEWEKYAKTGQLSLSYTPLPLEKHET